jgi:hypothetical protein
MTYVNEGIQIADILYIPLTNEECTRLEIVNDANYDSEDLEDFSVTELINYNRLNFAYDFKLGQTYVLRLYDENDEVLYITKIRVRNEQ